MYVYMYRTVQLYVQAPTELLRLFGLGLWRLRREIPSTAKEKQPVLNTCLGRAIASKSPDTIGQKAPDNNTHQLDS